MTGQESIWPVTGGRWAAAHLFVLAGVFGCVGLVLMTSGHSLVLTVLLVLLVHALPGPAIVVVRQVECAAARRAGREPVVRGHLLVAFGLVALSIASFPSAYGALAALLSALGLTCVGWLNRNGLVAAVSAITTLVLVPVVHYGPSSNEVVSLDPLVCGAIVLALAAGLATLAARTSHAAHTAHASGPGVDARLG